MPSPKCACAVALALLGATGWAHRAHAASYNESTNGDLSGIPASPTPWTLDVGANPLIGAAGTGTSTEDFDLISFTIPAGTQLDSISLNQFHNTFGLSFFGLQPGTPWLDVVGANMVGNHLSHWTLLSNGDGVTDLLAALQGVEPPSQTPLASGVYTLEMQDIDTLVQYSFTFNVSSLGGAPGDFTGNNIVDGLDLAQWKGDFGVDDGSDADNDNDSDGADFLIWQRHFGTGVMAHAVPEPSAAGMVLCALWAASIRRRRSDSRRN